MKFLFIFCSASDTHTHTHTHHTYSCFLTLCSRARPQFAVWASIHILSPNGQILIADAKGGGREHYMYPVDDHWFKVIDDYMEQKGLSLWSIDPAIATLSMAEKIAKFDKWKDERNLA